MSGTPQSEMKDNDLVAELSGVHVTLTRDRNAIPALRGVDLQVRRGEIVGLVGESGSGKSILGLTLLGLLPPESSPQMVGTATVDGVDMQNSDKAELHELRRQHLGAVFQDPMTSLDPTMRIGAQLIEVAGSTRAAIDLLTEVGFPDPARRLKAYPHELSGGLRQRVTIAIAVAGEPRMIIADEPTTALDVTVQAQILELLSRLRRDLGCSVLFITHDLAVASQVADRIAVLYAGRIAELAPTGNTPSRTPAPVHGRATAQPSGYRDGPKPASPDTGRRAARSERPAARLPLCSSLCFRTAHLREGLAGALRPRRPQGRMRTK